MPVGGLTPRAFNIYPQNKTKNDPEQNIDFELMSDLDFFDNLENKIIDQNFIDNIYSLRYPYFQQINFLNDSLRQRFIFLKFSSIEIFRVMAKVLPKLS